LTKGSSSPELFFITPGLDSMAWRTLLDFCADHRATWRGIVGDCALCRKLFEKSRADRKYCCAECRSRASYISWRDKGNGLGKRKTKRIASSTNP